MLHPPTCEVPPRLARSQTSSAASVHLAAVYCAAREEVGCTGKAVQPCLQRSAARGSRHHQWSPCLCGCGVPVYFCITIYSSIEVTEVEHLNVHPSLPPSLVHQTHLSLRVVSPASAGCGGLELLDRAGHKGQGSVNGHARNARASLPSTASHGQRTVNPHSTAHAAAGKGKACVVVLQASVFTYLGS